MFFKSVIAIKHHSKKLLTTSTCVILARKSEKPFPLCGLLFSGKVPMTIWLGKPMVPIGRLEKASPSLDKPRPELLMAW